MTLLLVLCLLFQDNKIRAYRGSVNDDPELQGQRKEFHGQVKLDKHGNGIIAFAPFELLAPPSCAISNVTHPQRDPKFAIYASDVTSKDHLLLKGPKGDVAKFDCHGIMENK